MFDFNLISIGVHGQWLTIRSSLGLMFDLDTRWLLYSMIAVVFLRARKIYKKNKRGF